MYSLPIIQRMNAKRAAAPLRESETIRHCSIAGDSIDGIVLHSARTRSTAFLSGGAQANRFLGEWYGTNSVEARDKLVESYFNALPLGKQKST
jgi:hypothetical protein